MTIIEMLPLSRLVPSKRNVRKTNGGQTIDQLVASIASHGLLQNLSVVPLETDGAPTGKYAVVAGGRRLAALKALARAKAIPGNHPVPCVIKTVAEAQETSLAENIVREAMHPADEMEAFRDLINEGSSIEDVAVRFGVAPIYVQRRLKLANVSPVLVELYRKGEISADHMKAFSVSDSHEAQETAWKDAPSYRRDPASIRAALSSGDVDPGRDRRARFVGLDAYRAAGGTQRQDLFAAPEDATWTDAALVERLAVEKLETIAATVRGEGWAWVEARCSIPYEDRSCCSRVYPVRVPLCETDRAELDALESAFDELAEQPGADEAEVIALREKIQAIEDRADQWPAEILGTAGVFISLDYDGALLVERGYVRPEDRHGARSSNEGQGDSRDANADEIASPGGTRKPISDRLMTNLTAHRTMALRAALMMRPDIALVSIVHNLMGGIFYGSGYGRPSALEIRIEQSERGCASKAECIEGSTAQKALSDRQGWWRLRIPATQDAAWGWLLEQSQETLLDLLAYCTAETVNAVRHPHTTLFDERLVACNDLASALQLDMADWWAPTKESYLGSVSKSTILEAVREGVSQDAAENLAGLKKAALVEEAERRLAGSRWLPGPLRVGSDETKEGAHHDELSTEESSAVGLADEASQIDGRSLAA